MSDDTEVRETRDTPSEQPSEAPSAPAGEPRESRDSPPAEAAPLPAQQQAADAHESDPLYQQLPEGWKRKVRDGSESLLSATTKHARNQQGYALRIQRETQERIAHEARERQQAELRTQQRLDQLTRLLSGEPDPAEAPVDPLAAQLAAIGQKVDAVGLLAAQQAEEAQINQQIDGLETWTATDVAQVLPSVPDYEQREEFVLAKMEDGELLLVQQENPHLSDQQAQALAHRRVQGQVANMMVNYAQRGQSLAQAVTQLSASLGYGQQQPQYQPPPPPRQTATSRQIDVQRQRAQSAAGLAGGARPSTFKGSPEQIQDAILNLSDEGWADFIGDGPDRRQRLKDLLRPYESG